MDLIENITTNENLDKIFYDKLPKDLVILIFSFINIICNDCNNCCDICKINCYFTEYCNRNHVCFLNELNRLVNEYEIEKEKLILEEKKKNL